MHHQKTDTPTASLQERVGHRLGVYVVRVKAVDDRLVRGPGRAPAVRDDHDGHPGAAGHGNRGGSDQGTGEGARTTLADHRQVLVR